jgi:hypothetical protein
MSINANLEMIESGLACQPNIKPKPEFLDNDRSARWLNGNNLFTAK